MRYQGEVGAIFATGIQKCFEVPVRAAQICDCSEL